jgi:hypothetical protein
VRVTSSAARARLLSRLRGWIPETLLVVVTTAVGLGSSGRWLDPGGDPGGWWSLLERVGQGERVYRDVFLQYGPFSPYFLALLARVFGLSPTSFLLMNWVPAILLGVLLLRAGRPYLTEVERLGVVGLLLGLSIFASGSARLVLPYCPAAVHALIFSVIALRLLQRAPGRRSDPLIAGGLAGLAFCCKQEIGVAILLALCVPVLTRPSGARGWLLPALAGFSGVASVGLLVVFGSASFDSLRYDNHFWPVGVVPTEWRYLSGIATGLLIREMPARLAGEAVAFAYEAVLLGLLGLLFGRDPRVRRPLLLVLLGVVLIGGALGGVLVGRGADPLCLSMVIAFALALAALLDRKQPGRDFLAAFGVFAGVVASRTAFACHIGWSPYSGVTGAPTALSWALFLFCFLPRIFPGGHSAARLTRWLWAAVLLPVAAYTAWDGIQSLRSAAAGAVPVETPRGRVFAHGALAPFLGLLAKNLHPGERTLVLPESNAVEALFELRSASPHLYHLPGWLDARAESMLLRRFERDPPEVVVLFVRSTWEFGVKPFGRGFGKRLAAWLIQNYRVVARAPGGVVLRPRPQR